MRKMNGHEKPSDFSEVLLVEPWPWRWLGVNLPSPGPFWSVKGRPKGIQPSGVGGLFSEAQMEGPDCAGRPSFFATKRDKC